MLENINKHNRRHGSNGGIEEQKDIRHNIEKEIAK